MEGRYRVDEIEIFRVLWVAVVRSPGTAYRVLVELQNGVVRQRCPNTNGDRGPRYLEQVQNSNFGDGSTKGSRRGTVNTRSYEQAYKGVSVWNRLETRPVPPFEPPLIVSLSAAAYLFFTRYSLKGPSANNQ